MNRESFGTAVIAAVCVLAVVFAAATISSPVETTSKGNLGTSGDGEGGAGDDPGGKGLDVEGDEATESGFVELQRGEVLMNPPQFCIPFLQRPIAIFGIVAGFLGFAYLVKRRIDGVAAVGVSLTFAIPVFLVYVLLSSCNSEPKSVGLPQTFVGGGSGSDGSVGVSDAPVAVDPTQVPMVLYLVMGIALVGVLAFALSDRGGFAAALDPIWSGNDEAENPADDSPPPTAAATLGRLAGNAADRIEEDGADVENEVYRAWREMTDPLDVERPHSSTPAEFATAATEAGVSRADVDELTHLFEEVRYGGYDPDEERESRAVDALRRIESQYADLGEDGEES